MRTTAKLLCFLCVLALLSGYVFGQAETGSISGTVTDPSGAVVSGATVTAKSAQTGATRTTTTNGSGLYNITSLPPGQYAVTITAPNFAKFTQNVGVTVGSRNEVSAKLAVGTEGTTVEVVAGSTNSQVETQSSELSTVVNAQAVSQLPTLTRNPYDLVGTAGNVQEANCAFPPCRGTGFNINGQRNSSTDVLLDGAQNVDTFTASVGQSVPLDSVQEFRVTTSDFSAEYGRASGGVVNVATKSGTNAFHGSAYEFNRISHLASNTFDNNATGTPKGVFTRNQFGYSIGGPIVKDKLFFFSSTEWTRVRSNSNVLNWVPDPALIAASDPGTTGAFFSTFGALRSGAVKTQTLTISDLAGMGSFGTTNPKNPHPLSDALLASNPTLPALDLVRFGVPTDAGGGSPQNTWNSVLRADYNLTDKTQMFARYSVFHDNFFPGTINFSPYAGFDTGEHDLNQNVLVSLTHLFSPSVVGSVKVSYNRLNQLQPLGQQPVGPTLFLAGGAPLINGQTLILPGYAATTPGNAIPFGGPQNQGEITPSVSWSKGAHQFRFGADYLYTKDNRVFGAYEEAADFYDASGSNSNGFEGMLSGLLDQYSVALFPQGKFPCFKDTNTGKTLVTPACTLTPPITAPNFSRSNRYNDVAAYAQDTWKVNSRLSLNLGVRWEYYGVQHSQNPNFDSNFYLGSGANLIQQIASGQALTVPNSPDHSLWKPKYNNFAPRVGFAWDIFGDGKTAFRGGYGIAYERNFGNVTFNVIQNPPNYGVVNLTGGIPLTVDQFAPINAGTPHLSPTTLRAVDQNIPTAYANIWNASLEREVAKNTVVALEYSGSQGVHQYDIVDWNRIGSGGVYMGYGDPAVKINPQFSHINHRGAGGSSSYNALNTRFSTTNFMNSGVTLNANYTWSHSIDDLSSAFSEDNQDNNLGYLNPFNPRFDRGDSNTDARHRIALSAVWDLPMGKNSTGFVKHAIGGWELAPIFTAHSGYPYTIYDCSNNIGDAACARYIPSAPPALSGSTSIANPTAPNTFPYETLPIALAYFDPVVGSGELPTCLGLFNSGCSFPANMSRRNAFRQPGAWFLNMGIYKNFKLTERFNMQFRSEFYNLFNHSNYYVQTGGPFNNGGAADVSAVSTLFFPASGLPESTTGYTIPGKKGATPATLGGLGERRFIQFALKLTF